MLSCHILHNPDQKNEVLEQFIGEDTHWVVSDLQAKFWMQSFLRKKLNKIICGDHVVRASELWQRMLLEEEPEWQIITPDLAQFFIEKWLGVGVKELQLSISNKDRRKAYQTIGQILPLLCHLQGQDLIEEWFAESLEAKERWYEWYRAGKYLWEKFFEKKIVPSEWIKGILVNKEMKASSYQFVFDLGLDIDDVESELILNLSRVSDVEVIIPQTDEPIEAYESLISRCQPQQKNEEIFSNKKVYKKLPSMLSEVKDAVAQVRRWADQGVELEKIAIVSPAIENYWPTLSEYLLVEGVSANKNIVAPLSQFEVYQSWLSSIRFTLSNVESVDGQQLFYDEESEPIIEFPRYKQLFENVYDVDDFKKSADIQAQLPPPINPKEEVSFSQFIEWSVALFKKEQSQQFDQLLQNFDEVYIVDEKLSYEKWLEFFENYFSRTEKTIETNEGSGIAVLSPASVQNIPLEKMVFLGLSEQNLIETQDTALHWTDIESIKVKFGFTLPHADRFKLLQAFEWIEKKDISEIIYYHAETDFSGRFQSPSLYWLKGAVEQEHSLEIEAPHKTRWDQLMQNDPSGDLPFSSAHIDSMEQFIQRDLGEKLNDKTLLSQLSLSASTLEEYFKCPFRFFSQKGLHLSDLPSLDLDIDRMTKGSLIHKICENIVKAKNFSLNDSALYTLIDNSRNSIEMEIYNEELWGFVRPYYFQLAKRFMEFEVLWRNEYPATNTVATEKFLKTHIQLKDDKIVFSKDEGIPFRGVIDRIDATEDGQYVILDYKSSGNSLTAHKSWLEKGKLQLALYSLALQEGVVTGQPENVVGAFYYIIKNMDRKKGFSINEAPEDFLPVKKTKTEERDQLLEETSRLTYSLIQRIKEGDVQTKPSDQKLCNDCQWNKLCRYPNLNI